MAEMTSAAPQPTYVSPIPVTVSFTFVVSDGLGALSYQWKADGVDITDATTDTYMIESARLDDATSYTCAVSDSGSDDIVSNAATLTVNEEDQVPVTGMLGLGLLASAFAAVAALSIRRKK